MTATRLPSLKLLIGFEAAARLSNYSRAADELCISQSAVSHQIAQLERQVGQALFRRKGRGVELTVAGRLLLDSVSRSFEIIRGGLTRIETYLDPHLVTLVCPAYIAQGWLQPRINRLLADHPLLCPIISVDETARYIDEMDVDIALTREPLRQAGVFETPLLSDELIAVCTPVLAREQVPMAQGNRSGGPGLICLESDLTDEAIGRHLRTTFGHLRKVAIYDDPRLLLDAALRGRGIAVVSRLLADDTLGNGTLVHLDQYPALPNGTLWISRTAGEPRLPLVREVFESLLRYSQSS